MKPCLSNLRSTEAAEIAEAALVLPVVFMFLLGIIWFGRAFNIYSTIQQAAQQGAITAARPYCATCTDANTFPTKATIANAVDKVLQASNLDPSSIKDNPLGSCAIQSHITICTQVQLNSTPQPQTCGAPLPTPTQICGAIVTFKYPFQFSLPFTSLNWSQIYLYAQAQSRMEN